MGFLSKIFPKEKKKEGPNIKAIDYEMESLERELREYEQQRLARGNAPRPQPAPGQQIPQQAQPMAQPQPAQPMPAQQTPQQVPPPAYASSAPVSRPLGQPKGIMVMDTPSKSEDSEVNNFEQSEHDRGAVIQPDGSNVKTIDLETSATVVDMDSEKVVDQDFKEVQKEPRQEKDISEVSVILPVTPSEELKEPEGTATPEDVAASPTEPDAERPAEVQTAPDQEPQTETSSETALAPAEAPINELTPAPELTPVTEEAPQETPQTPAEATEPEKPTPAVAVDAGTPKVQKKPKKSDGSPDELVAKLDDILKVLEKKVGSAGASGKDMTEAKKAITEARDHFNNKRYKTAKELAVKVKQMVV